MTIFAFEHRTVLELAALSMYDLERDLHDSLCRMDITRPFMASSSSPSCQCLMRAHEADDLPRASGQGSQSILPREPVRGRSILVLVLDGKMR